MKRKGMSMHTRKAATGFAFVLPFLLGFAVFTAYPII